MNEWFKKTLTQIKTLWGKWTLVQKGILGAVIVAAVVIIILLASWSAKPSVVPLIDTPITDAAVRERIVLRLNEENVKATVSQSGVISVSDEQTARRMRAILLREDLIPQNTDPWALFDVERWTRTDFERNIDIRRAVIEEVRKHIKALDDIDDVNVVINPAQKETVLKGEEVPASASVILYPKPGSDISTNRRKIEGIQKLLKYAVSDLKDENISIADNSGNILNDFTDMKDFDRLTIVDDYMFCTVMEDTQLCKELLSMVLKKCLHPDAAYIQDIRCFPAYITGTVLLFFQLRWALSPASTQAKSRLAASLSAKFGRRRVCQELENFR